MQMHKLAYLASVLVFYTSTGWSEATVWVLKMLQKSMKQWFKLITNSLLLITLYLLAACFAYYLVFGIRNGMDIIFGVGISYQYWVEKVHNCESNQWQCRWFYWKGARMQVDLLLVVARMQGDGECLLWRREGSRAHLVSVCCPSRWSLYWYLDFYDDHLRDRVQQCTNLNNSLRVIFQSSLLILWYKSGWQVPPGICKRGVNIKHCRP